MSHKHKNKKYNPNNKPIMENGHILDTSPRVVHTDKLKEKLNIRPFPWTEKQKQLIELILDKETKVVFIQGVAGTSKSLTSIYCGLKLLDDKKISSVLYLRTAIESSSKSLGFLQGSKEEKMSPYMEPCLEKMRELLPPSQINKLIEDKKVEADVVNYMRGRQLDNILTVVDESQNFTFKEILTIITRVGKYSKIIFCGDAMQADIKDSGFKKIIDIFNDEESRQNGIHSREFSKEDIMRSDTVKFIIGKLEAHQVKISKEAMFV